MSTEQVYHYVYRITNIVENKHYYGKRSSKVLPTLDIGVKYFSSSSDKDFIRDQKENPQNYKYKVVSIHSTDTAAVTKEIRLHIKFNVKDNVNFYNRANQLSNGVCLSSDGHPMKGKHHKESTKDKIRNSLTGYKHPICNRVNMGTKIGTRVGNKHPMAKSANIYNYTDGSLVAENIVIKEWCRLNNYNQGAMSLTLLADFSKPSSRTNHHHHKGVYARYVDPVPLL